MNKPYAVNIFKCQYYECALALVVPSDLDGDPRGIAREVGWSVASDDEGSEAICPEHRADFGR